MMKCDLEKKLLNKAVQLLAQRSFSSYELKQKLLLFLSGQSIDIPFEGSIEPRIEKIIQYCLDHHWLDDNQYISQYIDMRSRKGYGRHRIIMELKQRGIERSSCLAILQQKEVDWILIGINQVKKKYRDLNKSDIKQKAKIYQFLSYRGFEQEDIYCIYASLF